MLVGSRRRPRVINAVDDDSGFAFGSKLPGHRRAHEVDACLKDRRDVWLPRIDVRRKKESRTGVTLLMNVVDDLRAPDVVNLVDCKLSLNLRERVPIAIVVVSGVVMIKLGRVCALSRRAKRLVVPVLDYV